jgi:hypothetical protein
MFPAYLPKLLSRKGETNNILISGYSRPESYIISKIYFCHFWTSAICELLPVNYQRNAVCVYDYLYWQQLYLNFLVKLQLNNIVLEGVPLDMREVSYSKLYYMIFKYFIIVLNGQESFPDLFFSWSKYHSITASYIFEPGLSYPNTTTSPTRYTALSKYNNIDLILIWSYTGWWFQCSIKGKHHNGLRNATSK